MLAVGEHATFDCLPWNLPTFLTLSVQLNSNDLKQTSPLRPITNSAKLPFICLSKMCFRCARRVAFVGGAAYRVGGNVAVGTDQRSLEITLLSRDTV